MNEAELKDFTIGLNGVTRFDLEDLGLIRYLIHDVPFCVFGKSCDGRSVLHLRLDRAKIKELKALFPLFAVDSQFYVSRQWLMLYLDCGLRQKIIKEIITGAYLRTLNTFPVLSRTVYFESDPVRYNLDYKLILKRAERPPDIDYGVKPINKTEHNSN